MLELCLGYAGQVDRAVRSVGEDSDLRGKGTSCSEGRRSACPSNARVVSRLCRGRWVEQKEQMGR